MPTVWVPTLPKKLTNGIQTVEIEGQSVRDIIESLDATYPGMKSRLCDEDGTIRTEIAVAVDGQIVTTGIRTRVSEYSEVHFLPALSGG